MSDTPRLPEDRMLLEWLGRWSNVTYARDELRELRKLISQYGAACEDAGRAYERPASTTGPEHARRAVETRREIDARIVEIRKLLGERPRRWQHSECGEIVEALDRPGPHDCDRCQNAPAPWRRMPDAP